MTRARENTADVTALPKPTDPDGFFLPNRGGDIHVVDEGEKNAPAVVLIHGIPGSVRDFRYLGPALVERGLRAIRIDMPGFGQTPRSAFASTSLVDRAAFLRATARAVGARRFAVLGHSFGAGMAYFAAASYPEDVVAVASVNGLGVLRHRGLVIPPRITGALGEALRVPLVGDVLARELTSSYARRGLRSDIPLDVETLLLHCRLVGAIDFAALRSAVRRLRCPALLLSAQDDPIVQPAVPFATASALTSASVMSHLHFPEGKHFLQKHQAPRIARWLADRLIPGAPSPT